MSRRMSFLFLGALLVVFMVTAVGFGQEGVSQERVQYETPAAFLEATGQTLGSFQESPQLSVRVAAQEIDSLEDRLPVEPAVLQPLEAIGNYGGTYRRAWRGPSDHWGIRQELREQWVYIDPSGEVRPNVPKSYEIINDGRTFVFHMREGMRWSDGEPVTAHDSIFWWDMKLDEDMYHVHRQEFIIDGNKPEVELIDDYTWSITFSSPHPTFLEATAMEGRADFLAPKHFLAPFYPKYTPMEEVQAKVEEHGYADWTSLLNDMYQIPQTTHLRPVIWAWYPVNHPSSDAYTFERNPYYWKVDSEGNQLPYIDRYVNENVSDPELMIMKIMAGDISLQARHLGIADFPVLMENAERGNYSVLPMTPVTMGSDMALHFNLNHKDPVKRELFSNPRFKQALSVAIDREEINELLFLGLGLGQQAVFAQSGFFWTEEWSQHYAQYDPTLAEQILDEIGLERGSDGLRRYPDGRPLEIYAETSDGNDAESLELIAAYWGDLGIRLHINTPERSLFYERVQGSADYDMATWSWGFARPDIRETMPITWQHAPLWQRWLETSGTEGEEPPAEVQRMYDVLADARSRFSVEERREVLEELIQFHMDNIYVIGVVGEAPGIMVATNRLGNVEPLMRDRIYNESRLMFVPALLYFRQ